MGELSHFCAACFAGKLPDCDGSTAEYTFHELHCATKKTVAGVGLARDAQVDREARARKLLRNGRNAGARAGDWVMIHIREMNDPCSMLHSECAEIRRSLARSTH